VNAVTASFNTIMGQMTEMLAKQHRLALAYNSARLPFGRVTM